MLISWKVFLTIFILYTIAIDGNRVSRRRRRQAPIGNGINQQQQLPPNPRVLNGPDQPPSPQGGGPNGVGTAKQGGRQYYSPYQGQYGGGYGSIQSLNYPYAGAGVGSYNYGTGQYGQYGGMGQYGYGSYNQNPSYYSGYNSGSYYNRPGYSNYYPSSGSNYYGGYFWNAGQKQNINKFTVFLSTMLTLLICLITV